MSTEQKQKLGWVKLPKGVRIWQLIDAQVVEVPVSAPTYDGKRKVSLDPRYPSCIAINLKNAKRKLGLK